MIRLKPSSHPAPSSSREKILAISTRLFARYGFEGVAMRQIAKEAAITLPSIYHHFGNKEDLYRAVEINLYTNHAVLLTAALTSADAASDKLRSFIEILLKHLMDNPDYLKLLQRGLIDDWEDNHVFLVEMSLQAVFDQLKFLLEQQRPGSGEGIHPVFIFSSIIGYLTMRPVVKKLRDYPFARTLPDEEQRVLTETILNHIL